MVEIVMVKKQGYLLIALLRFMKFLFSEHGTH